MGRKIEIFSKILTLSYPKYRFFTFLGVLIILFLIPINYFESMPNLSICSRILGENCYSVGIMRGVSSLLKGNFSQGINYNSLAIPTLIVMIGIMIHDLIKINSKR